MDSGKELWKLGAEGGGGSDVSRPLLPARSRPLGVAL